MEEKILKLEREIQELKREMAFLSSSNTIPFNTEQAFRDRLGIQSLASLSGSTKTAASETQSVSESGSSSYSVAKPMDGFREFVVGGSVLYIPYYT